MRYAKVTNEVVETDRWQHAFAWLPHKNLSLGKNKKISGKKRKNSKNPEILCGSHVNLLMRNGHQDYS